MILLCVFFIGMKEVWCQQTKNKIRLTLEQAIKLAADSSVEAYRIENVYLAKYWEYRNYKAARLPSLTLNLTPAKYNRDIVQRYLSDEDRDVYRTQQSYFSYGNLSLQQNIDLTGGTFYVNSSLSYLRSIGNTGYTQYSSVPVRFGYSQELLGYNPFKWDKLIEPLKIDEAKRERTVEKEALSQNTVEYFFDLILAQQNEELESKIFQDCDTLCHIGQEKYRIGNLSGTDLLSLNLERVDAQNNLNQAHNAKKKAQYALAALLSLPYQIEIELIAPEELPPTIITMERALVLTRENNPGYLEQNGHVLEAQQELDKVKKRRHLNANIDMSIGFNQFAEKIGGAYKRPMQQDVVSIDLTIPLLDWGIGKGNYNKAINNLNIAKAEMRRKKQEMDADVIAAVNDFQIQQQMVLSAKNAITLAQEVYKNGKESFMVGRMPLNDFLGIMKKQQETQTKYFEALKNCWFTYYKIRSMTLYDFQNNILLK
jgi:outer membrane protein TolC